MFQFPSALEEEVEVCEIPRLRGESVMSNCWNIFKVMEVTVVTAMEVTVATAMEGTVATAMVVTGMVDFTITLVEEGGKWSTIPGVLSPKSSNFRSDHSFGSGSSGKNCSNSLGVSSGVRERPF